MRKALPAALLFLVSCGGGSGSPTNPTPNNPTPSTFTLSGTVTSTQGGAIGGAIVKIADGPNANKSATTDGGGHYSLSSLTQSGFTVNFSAPYFNSLGKGVNLTSNQVVDAQLEPVPLFTRSGVGDNVFDMPRSVTRVRITGSYTRNTSNFIVKIDGHLIVNELLGTFWGQTSFSGTYVTSGGVVEITDSSGVAWSFTEVR